KDLRNGDEPITDPGFRDDVAGLCGIGLDLLAKVPDKNPEVFGLLGVVSAPHFPKQGPMGQNPIVVRDHVRKQLEFFRGEMDRGASDKDLMIVNVDPEVADLE